MNHNTNIKFESKLDMDIIQFNLKMSRSLTILIFLINLNYYYQI